MPPVSSIRDAEIRALDLWGAHLDGTLVRLDGQVLGDRVRVS